MLFWFCPILLIVSILGIFISTDVELVIIGCIFFSIVSLLFVPILIKTWSSHAYDVAMVRAQGPVIQVEIDHIERIAERLNSFNYPDGALMNADSPVASIVKSLDNAEYSLARAERTRAIAMRSIEARKVGPMGGIVTLLGDK